MAAISSYMRLLQSQDPSDPVAAMLAATRGGNGGAATSALSAPVADGNIFADRPTMLNGFGGRIDSINSAIQSQKDRLSIQKNARIEKERQAALLKKMQALIPKTPVIPQANTSPLRMFRRLPHNLTSSIQTFFLPSLLRSLRNKDRKTTGLTIRSGLVRLIRRPARSDGESQHIHPL
jgi:hypothetical protein